MTAGALDDRPAQPDPAVLGDDGRTTWARRNPGHLLRVFTVGAGVGILALLALVGVGVHRLLDHHIVGHAEINAIALSNVVFAAEHVVLTEARSKPGTLAVAPAAVPGLDERIRLRLRPLDVVRIEVFGRDGIVVYSTDRASIGQTSPGNAALVGALAGDVVSSLRTAARASGGDQKVDVDVVETYVPVRAGGEVIGAIAADTDVTWSRAQIAPVLRFSLVVALIVLLAVFGALFLLMRMLTRQLAGAQRDLERMAITDALTGLANRRYLMARAEDECARIARLRDKSATAGVGFIMADLDHFKPVNDTYGHLAGDRVLKDVGSRIRRVTRRYDVVGRYGGDEFLIVLPQADPGETRAVAERVWQTVRERPFPVGEGARPLTVSVGLACATPGDDDFTTVLKRADEALYEAKGAGRDRVAAR